MRGASRGVEQTRLCCISTFDACNHIISFPIWRKRPISQFRLAKRYGINPYDNNYQWWDEFPLDNIVSNTVTIEVVSVYTQNNNGFIEVEFYIGESE